MGRELPRWRRLRGRGHALELEIGRVELQGRQGGLSGHGGGRARGGVRREQGQRRRRDERRDPIGLRNRTGGCARIRFGRPQHGRGRRRRRGRGWGRRRRRCHRDGLRLRAGRRGRPAGGGIAERRQEALRVDVAVGIGEQAQAEMHVRDRLLGQAARADHRDRLAFGHHHPPADERRAEMEQRDGVAVGGLNRDRETVGRDRAREGHGPCCGRQHLSTERPLDVDPAVLARGERKLRREHEPLQDGARDRPRRGACGGRRSQCGE